MRKVIVQKYAQVKQEDGRMKTVKVELGMALFHQWGAGFEEFEQGPGNFTVAVVEHADGQVETVPADLIKFILGEV